MTRKGRRRAALSGACSADLPVERPATFELVIHGGTARTLGLAIPSTLQVRGEILD